MTTPSPLYLACRELIEAVDRWHHASGPVALFAAYEDVEKAQDKIRALLAGEEPK